MSTSPTPHALDPDSSPRQVLPQTNADLRSQAVARIKRSTSLPRTPDGRRPKPDAQALNRMANAPATLTVQPSQYDAEEVLSPSPVATTFDQSSLSPSASGTGMQRSASSSSSYHIPSPPHMTYGHPFGMTSQSSSSSPSITPDWSAMQFAQSYLSSLSPGAIAGSPFVPSNSLRVGRNTPSPLPTLVELRTLQRSNSAAARAQAMSKLTGGKETPSDEDHTIHAGSSRPLLQRADSLGASRVFGLITARAAQARPKEEPPVAEMAETRPRLQRSFTVSSSNMGEERRSAVGRRMVKRLAESRAVRDRDKDEITVRQLWEDRRVVHREEVEASEDSLGDDDTATMPLIERSLSTIMSQSNPNQLLRGDLLTAPDRSVSRNTNRSGEEAFEYAEHLRRSLSSRTTRVTVGPASDPDPNVILQLRKDDELEQLPDNHSLPQLQAATSSTRNIFATPIKHVPQSFRPNDEAALDNSSPSGHSMMSREALGSMLFTGGPGSPSGLVGVGKHNHSHWLTEAEDNGGSDWGTPAKDTHREWSAPEDSSWFETCF